jgi:hypothetical protein
MPGVVCYQVKIPAMGRSLVRRSLAECGVSECDRDASIRRKPWSTRGCCALEKKSVNNSDSDVGCKNEGRNINPLTPNDLQRRRAVSPLKIKIPSKNIREKPTNTPIIHSVY